LGGWVRSRYEVPVLAWPAASGAGRGDEEEEEEGEGVAPLHCDSHLAGGESRAI